MPVFLMARKNDGGPGWCKVLSQAHIGNTNLSRHVKTIRRHHGNLHVHTGTIYGVWHLLKQAIPDQLVTIKSKNKAETNSSLWAYIQTWQWRWEVGHTGDACMKATGKKLSLMANVNMSRSRRTKSQRNAKKAFLELHFRDLVPSDFIAKRNKTRQITL